MTLLIRLLVWCSRRSHCGVPSVFSAVNAEPTHRHPSSRVARKPGSDEPRTGGFRNREIVLISSSYMTNSEEV